MTYWLMLLFVFWVLCILYALYDSVFDRHKITLRWSSLLAVLFWRLAFACLGTFFFHNVW